MTQLVSETRTRIPFMDLGASHHPLRAQLDAAIAHVCASDTYIGGPHVEAFEQAWANYCHVPYAVGVANGTDALYLALRGLGIGPGEEVILPANTFVATAEAVMLAGATPVFCDVDEDSLLMDPVMVDALVSPRTSAVIAVHLYGHVADLGALMSYTRERGLALIEDAAQAHGAWFEGRRVGGWGDAGCFSFYPGKNLGALGDAGAVVCRDRALADRIRSLGDHGRDPSQPGAHPALGGNSRLDAVQAAALSVKLVHLDRWNSARRSVVERYAAGLTGTGIEMVRPPREGSVHHLAVARVQDRTDVRRRLAHGGIATGVHYPIPCHLQAPFRRFAHGPLPGVERAAREILSLPLYPQLAGTDVDRVVECLTSAVTDAPAGRLTP